jgi:hypothetical protein
MTMPDVAVVRSISTLRPIQSTMLKVLPVRYAV